MKFQDPANSARWIDLIAFLGVLSLGGILATAAGMTAASLATTCAALSGLYTAFKRFRIAGNSSHASDPSSQSDNPVVANRDGRADQPAR